ncbi:MAG: ribonuclease P protein component [Bacteroidales bacterium]|nr:ribonuclease P protein component [Bacteroidales bacterium]MBN2633704.1 ribonuclease P protein component [Bacteroidales bacterium]
MNHAPETFSKKERLCSKKIIALLFEEGEVLYTPLFRIIWIPGSFPGESPAQAAFSVSKKNFRRAVDRNLLKRRMREAYRKNKNELYNTLIACNSSIAFIVIFRAAVIVSYVEIEKAMNEVIKKLTIAVKAKKVDC